MSLSRPTIALINASRDAITVLESHLQPDFTTVHAYVRDLRLGHKDLASFLGEHDPSVVVWDLALPYYQNWAFLEQERHAGSLEGRALIITSPNCRRLDETVGVPTGALEFDERAGALEIL